MSLEIDIFRSALVSLYGNEGYVRKFSARIGRKPHTVYRWLRGEVPIPMMAKLVAIFLLREKGEKNDTPRDADSEDSAV